MPTLQSTWLFVGLCPDCSETLRQIASCDGRITGTSRQAQLAHTLPPPHYMIQFGANFLGYWVEGGVARDLRVAAWGRRRQRALLGTLRGLASDLYYLTRPGDDAPDGWAP